MRLKRIKLAGFKSFVDPTTFELASNLVAIVGPNGCGKSNTIDAVRLVLGESSAKSLRGEAISDVIFNGSSSRKPVGQASVELLFENSDGVLGGLYAQYSEISVKRVVSRDGQSQFYLNGTRCRRKDVTELFLGTGLGPRSYAVIEQGMISRLIEAKPEDLRLFLEEAAGISKYKERRHETELRMQHTRDNLARVNDVREELAKQYQRLEEQAKAATEYQSYLKEEQTLKGELAALQAKDYLKSQETVKEQLALQEQLLAAALSEEAAQITLQEKEQQHYLHSKEAYGSIHSEFYDLGNILTGLEHTLHYHQEKEKQLQEEIRQVAANLVKIKDTITADELKKDALTQEYSMLQPEKELWAQKLAKAEQYLQQIHAQREQHQLQYHHFLENSFEPTRLAESARAKITGLEDQVRHSGERIERLMQAQKNMEWQVFIEKAQELEKKLQINKEHIEEKSRQVADNKEKLQVERQALEDADKQQQQLQKQIQALHREEATLEALQKAGSKTQKSTTQWIEAQKLEQNQSLLQYIRVEKGWERALELVLGVHLDAIAVENIQQQLITLHEIRDGQLGLFEATPALLSNEKDTKDKTVGLPNLADKVLTPHPFGSFLKTVYLASTILEAEHLLSSLPSEASVILQCGLWLGKGWVRYAEGKLNDPAFGKLERAENLRVLKEEMHTQEQSLKALQEKMLKHKEAIHHFEKVREQLHQEQASLEREKTSFTSECSIQRTKGEQLKARFNQIQQEIQEIKQQQSQWNNLIQEHRSCLATAVEQMAAIQEQRTIWEQEQKAIEARWQAAGQERQQEAQHAHQKNMRLELINSELQALNVSLGRLLQQKTDLEQKQQNLNNALKENNAPIATIREDLSCKRQAKVQLEEQCNQAKLKVNYLEDNLKALEKKRYELQKNSAHIREKLEQLRIQDQNLQVRLEVVYEQLAALELEFSLVCAAMPSDAKGSTWSKRIEAISEKIKALGPVNLAAGQEFAECQERKAYLDTQFQDLTEALATLTDTIGTIDKETRLKFKETYEFINERFSQLFPRLFGGGSAYLELTDPDLLESGVQVMARPPGKRNSSIHQLSGGEKALSAVALVFSIFQLNPAPFCILDEVDAPLDEANVGRFCDLVREMSKTVQFIFISHNKITMEMADYLLGVTMREPGVSRLVSVNMAEAQAMAAEG